MNHITSLVSLVLIAILIAGCGGESAGEHVGAGLNRIAEGKYNEALTELTEAIRIDPDLAEAYIFRMTAYASLGEIAEARADRDRAVELGADPGDLDAIIGVAVFNLVRNPDTNATPRPGRPPLPPPAPASAPAPTLYIEAFISDESVGQVTVQEGVGTVTLRVRLHPGVLGGVRVKYVTSNGFAFSPGDYVAASGTVNVTNEARFATISISIVDDTLNEGDEMFTVTISDPDPPQVYLSPTNSSVTVTILDDD